MISDAPTGIPCSAPPIDRSSLITWGAILESASGEHLANVSRATGDDIELDGSAVYRAACHGRPVAEDAMFNIEMSCDLFADNIDLRKPVPAQVAQQLLAWSKQLLTMAVSVMAVPPQTLIMEPRAHLIIDAVTGETIECGPYCDFARDEMISHFKATGHQSSLATSPLREWPDQQAQFVRLVRAAIEKATGQDGEPTNQEDKS